MCRSTCTNLRAATKQSSGHQCRTCSDIYRIQIREALTKVCSLVLYWLTQQNAMDRSSLHKMFPYINKGVNKTLYELNNKISDKTLAFSTSWHCIQKGTYSMTMWRKEVLWPFDFNILGNNTMPTYKYTHTQPLYYPTWLVMINYLRQRAESHVHFCVPYLRVWQPRDQSINQTQVLTSKHRLIAFVIAQSRHPST